MEKKEIFAPISWEDAKVVIKHYQDQHQIMSATGSAIPISSFKILKDSVENIAAQTDKEEGKVYLAIGYHNDPPRVGETAGYTLIAFAVDPYGNLMKTNDSLAYDAKIGIIPANQALSSVANYQNNTTLKINTIDNKLLKGFNAIIRELEVLWLMEDVVDIEFLFGYRHEDPQNPDQLSTGYTLVIVGLDHTRDKITVNGSVFDYCHPCPNSCPNGAAVI